MTCYIKQGCSYPEVMRFSHERHVQGIRTIKDEQFTTRLISCFSFQKTYKTKVPYDPEGALGTLTSAFLVFLGAQVWLSLVVRLLPTSVN